MARTKITPEASALLGRVPDKTLALNFSLSKSGIARARIRSGIPAYDQTRVGKYVWNEQAESLLGSMSDGALAKILSISTQSVQQARTARGVAKFEPVRDTVPKIRGPREQKDLEKSPLGRKPLPEGYGKTARVQMKVRPAQKAEWQAKAVAAGLALQVWIEQQCDRLR